MSRAWVWEGHHGRRVTCSLVLSIWLLGHTGDRAQCILLCSDCSVYSGQDTALTADLPLPFCCGVCLLDRASERERMRLSVVFWVLVRKTSSWPLSDVYPNTIFGLPLRVRISSVTVLSQFFETNCSSSLCPYSMSWSRAREDQFQSGYTTF